MPFLIIAAIMIIAMVAAYLLMPTPQMENAKSKSLDEFSFPTNSNGRIVPEVFGTCEVRGNIIWYGDLRSSEIRK